MVLNELNSMLEKQLSEVNVKNGKMQDLLGIPEDKKVTDVLAGTADE